MKIYFNPNIRGLQKNAYLRHIASIVLLSLLCGCAPYFSSFRYFRGTEFKGFEFTAYPYCKKSTGEVKPGEAERFCMARQFARDRAKEYRDWYTSLKTENAILFDYPLITLAGVATGNLLFGSIPDLTKALGLGAATITAVRTYSNNTQRAGFFLQAEEAAQCLVEKSAAFMHTEDDKKSIQGAKKDLEGEKGSPEKGLLKQAEELLPKLDDNKPEEKAAKETLSSAITLGKSSIELASGAIRAMDDSVNKMVDSIYVIDRKLTSLIEKASPDVAAIVAKIQSTAQTSANTDKASATITQESQKMAGATKVLQTQLKKDQTNAQNAVTLADKIRTKGDEINQKAPKYIKADSDLSLCTTKL